MHGAATATLHRVGLDPLECHTYAPATRISGPQVAVINGTNYSTPIASTTATTALLLTPQGILAGLPAEPSPVAGLTAGLVSFTAFCEPDHVRVTNLRADTASHTACRACPASSRSLGGMAHECESCDETTCATADEIVFNTTFDASGKPARSICAPRPHTFINEMPYLLSFYTGLGLVSGDVVSGAIISHTRSARSDYREITTEESAERPEVRMV